MKVVIIGCSAGGAGVAARLRRLDESAEIIVFYAGEQDSPITIKRQRDRQEKKERNDFQVELSDWHTATTPAIMHRDIVN